MAPRARATRTEAAATKTTRSAEAITDRERGPGRKRVQSIELPDYL
jgi:hypothetical protein